MACGKCSAWPVGPSEAEPFWSAFLRSLTRRGLRGVKLVISDAHEGLKAAAAKVLKATWQRCKVHFLRNALAHAGKGQRQIVFAMINHSITYRVAVGPRAGQKVFSLQTVPARGDEPRKGVAQYAGFSLHAGIGVEADQRAKLERLARYVSRPPVSMERLDLTAQGQIRYRLKTPYGVAT